eukprot:5281035-Pyramimonas_sp.AAC.1
MGQFMKSRSGDPRPVDLYFITTVPEAMCIGSVGDRLDLWSHALLSAKWAAVVKDKVIMDGTYEVILPGRGPPRMTRAGLAIFRVRPEGVAANPRLGVVRHAICEIDAPRTLTLDMRASDFFRVSQLLDAAALQ